MTSFEVEHVPFRRDALAAWAEVDPRHTNWPVVYTIDGADRVYIGETTQVAARMRQHLARPDRAHLESVRVIVDDTYNKSACLDLESFLIRMFAGDGKYTVDNATVGLTESDYYQRERYREQFTTIFETLRTDGLFDKSVAQIENSDLFKLSPYKALTYDQRVAVLGILEKLFDDLRLGRISTAVVQGQPGTGKTIVGIYLMKLIGDIQRGVTLEETDSDAIFAGFFTPQNAELLRGLRMGLVIPQQALRKTVTKVFRKTPGLDRSQVLSPMAVGDGAAFDLLIVDEAHRLQQLSATLPTMITKFKKINRRLFGDERGGHQLDWIRRQSKHQIFLLDVDQTVKPADLPSHVLRALEQEAAASGHRFTLKTQMRVKAGTDYVGFVRDALSGVSPEAVNLGSYDFKLFDDLGAMRRAIKAREAEFGLARLVAGYAWKWRSKTDSDAFDIEIDEQRLRWNSATTDWISSPKSADEVGSIHTTQGYDLNYAGVIIGPDLRFNREAGRLYVVRDSYFDAKGKANNKMLGIEYSDDDLLKYITNIYVVLLTRGIRGTYVYVCDPALREYLSRFIPPAESTATPPDVRHPTDHELQIEFGERETAPPSQAPEPNGENASKVRSKLGLPTRPTD